METESDVYFDLKKNKRKGSLTLKFDVQPINISIEKLSFAIHKKTGVKFKDAGVVDLKVKDAGIYFEFLIKFKYDSIAHISLTKCRTSIRKFKINVVEAKHDILDKFVTSIFLPGIKKKKLRKKIGKTLYNKINVEMCDRINDALKKLEANRKKKEKNE